MSRHIDLTGRRFGRLTAQLFLSDGVCSYWLCLCACGNQTMVAAGDLKKSAGKCTTSCGCWRRERCGKTGREHHRIKHGQARRGRETPEFLLWQSAYFRSKIKGLSFTISVSDIFIPKRCPVFGTPLISHRGDARKFWYDDSPTLDRIIPSLGYIPSNVWVISYRANKIKSDASLEELNKIIEAIRGIGKYAQI